MKRWAFTDILAVGLTLFVKIHKQKRFANPNNNVHFMASDMDDWQVLGVRTLIDGTYTLRFLK
jgi:RNA-directed DNA polymerase